jgi:hypothetical protein
MVADGQQPRFSFSIDAGVMRSLKKEQRFWAPGQTITSHFHLTPKNGIYVFFNYHINGRFHNQLTATAKSPATNPQRLNYGISATMILTHISAGWKRYLFGTFDRDTKGNFYGYGGLGLMMGKLDNKSSVLQDTAIYEYPVTGGKGRFKRLTIDVGLGYERPIGGDLFLYVEGRSHIPITNYPTSYLLVNGYVPLNVSAFVGLRMLFD